MEYKKLGLTDLQVSRLGFGACAIGGHDYGAVDDDESVAAILDAIDMGVNFFDTADVYGFGHSEEILGKALGLAHEHDVVVSTKFGVAWDVTGKTFRDCSPSHIVKALNASLARLKTDCIPLYQMHWYDGTTPLDAVFETLERCRAAGKIRYYGCSNFAEESLRLFSRQFPIHAVQVPFSLADTSFSRYISEAAGSLEMGTVVYNVLGRGVLTGKFKAGQIFTGSDTRKKHAFFDQVRFAALSRLVEILEQIGARYGKSPGQIAIRWVLDTTAVTTALVGIKNRAQLSENVDVCGWKLHVDDYTLLAQLSQSFLDGEKKYEREHQG